MERKRTPSVHPFVYSPMESYYARPWTGPGNRAGPALMEQTVPWGLQVSIEAGTTGCVECGRLKYRWLTGKGGS